MEKGISPINRCSIIGLIPFSSPPFLPSFSSLFFLEEIDAAVAERYGIEPAVLKTHGHHAGPAKAVAVALASRLADENGRRSDSTMGSVPPRSERSTAGLPTGTMRWMPSNRWQDN